jgi:hypothetical protein
MGTHVNATAMKAAPRVLTMGNDEDTASVAAARKLAETRARCAAASAYAEQAVRHAHAGLAAAVDRLRRARAVNDEFLASRDHLADS